MSVADADAYLERVEQDEEFALHMREVSGNFAEAQSRIREAGFEFDPDEMVTALSDRYGVELTPEQLDQIAAGDDTGTIVAGVVGGAVLIGAVASVAAMAAA